MARARWRHCRQLDRRWFLAIPWAEKLVSLDPADPQARQFLAQVRAGAQADPGR
jgi:hypothetical protein